MSTKQVRNIANERSFDLEVQSGDTVKALKNKIQDAEGISPDFIQLQMKGLALGDEVSLANLEEGAIDMTMTLRGGEEANHCCHFILFLVTGGLWTPFWIGACCDCCCQRPCNS